MLEFLARTNKCALEQLSLFNLELHIFRIDAKKYLTLIHSQKKTERNKRIYTKILKKR